MFEGEGTHRGNLFAYEFKQNLTTCFQKHMRRNFDKLKTVVISLDLFQNSGRIIDYEFAYVNLSKIWQLDLV